MGMRLEHEIRILPDSYVTTEVQYAFEEDPKQKKDRWGNARSKMVSKVVESRGGILIVVKGKPGHSIRLQNLEQALDLKLIDDDAYKILLTKKNGIYALKPRIVDTETGEAVNEHGVPLRIAAELENGTMMPKNAGKHARGNVETDIDVNTTGDEDIAGNEMPVDDAIMAGHEIIEKQIDETE